ncbi:MAG: hypothetical protein LBP67_01805 [Bacteroidales bacterium]|nr:hypothetical protein [Bacteroidales bacterium]
MVAQETGIYRANICRYVREFKKNDRLFLVRKGICPISKHRAGFYTSNEDNIEFTYKDGFYIPNEDKNIVGYDQNKRHE